MPSRIAMGSLSREDVAHVPTLWVGDVLVVGGGSAGASAAVAAARSGASTLLLESGAFLGGTGTRVLDTFYGFYAPGPDSERVVGGVGWEVCTRLQQSRSSFERPNTYGAGTGITYDPEALKVVWDELVQESGAEVLFYALMTAVVAEGGTVRGILVETKGGLFQIEAQVIIDATGDGEIAWRVGETTHNRDDLHSLQPATSTFRVGGVGEDVASTKELHREMQLAQEAGSHRLPRVEGSIHITTEPGIRHTNLTRVTGKDLTDPWQLSWAEQEGRRQSWEYLRFLKDKVRGFENAFMIQTSSRLGVRETRRLTGEFVLSAEDFRGARSHEDDVARCGAPIEDHSAGSGTRWEYVGGLDQPDGASYGIPFGTLVPRATEGLLVAGRCLSATHEAHASARSIGQCTAMGHAAGAAAAMAVFSATSVRSIDRIALRRRLVGEGAIV